VKAREEADVALVLAWAREIEENIRCKGDFKTDVFVALVIGPASPTSTTRTRSSPSIAMPAAPAHGTEVDDVACINRSLLVVAKRENSVILQEDNYKEQHNGSRPHFPAPEPPVQFISESAYMVNSIRFAQRSTGSSGPSCSTSAGRCG
jgi:N-acetylmuramoyl-L-alanine amidase